MERYCAPARRGGTTASLSHAAVGSRIVGRPYALPYARFVAKIVNHIAFGLVVEDVAHSLDERRFQTISLRLPKHLLDGIRLTANARDVPYQSLIKVWLQEKLEQRR
jgi:hypothetical protein